MNCESSCEEARRQETISNVQVVLKLRVSDAAREEATHRFID